MDQQKGLLSVDVGLKTAFACFDARGRLTWLQSRRFSNPGRLRRGIPSLIQEMPPFSSAILEGGGALTKIWQKEFERLQLPNTVVHAEQWREDLLYPREQRSGAQAKEAAQRLYEEVIRWSGLGGSYSQQHDAAEAVLCGIWWLTYRESLEDIPGAIRNRIKARK